jgi:hypothetical protein
MTLINWDLMKYPVNWISVLLMVIIAGVILDVAAQFASQEVQSQQS